MLYDPLGHFAVGRGGKDHAVGDSDHLALVNEDAQQLRADLQVTGRRVRVFLQGLQVGGRLFFHLWRQGDFVVGQAQRLPFIYDDLFFN